MKLKKEFVPLIKDKIKKFEFRNTNDKDGFYLIDKKLFHLALEFDNVASHIIKIQGGYSEIDLTFNDGKSLTLSISQPEAQWILSNSKYFYDLEGNYQMFVYRWLEVKNPDDIKTKAIKKIEVVK